MCSCEILLEGFVGQCGGGDGIAQIAGNRSNDLFGQSRDIAGDVVQGVFKENGSVVHLHHEAALRVMAGADRRGVPVCPDGSGLDVYTQNADIGKSLFPSDL